MLPQISNIINSYSVYGVIDEYNNTFGHLYNDETVCTRLNGIFYYNYRHIPVYGVERFIHNIETGKIPNITVSENY